MSAFELLSSGNNASPSAWDLYDEPPLASSALRCNLTRAPNPDGSESRVVVDWYYGEAGDTEWC